MQENHSFSRGNNTKNSNLRSSRQQAKPFSLSESRGLLPKPPQNVQHKYTFTKPISDTSAFCGCISYLGESWTEIYVSPNEIVSREQLLHHVRPSICASKE